MSTSERPRVVVGLDDSPGAGRVLAAAERERRYRSAALEVVGVWRLPTSYGWVLSPNLVEDLKAHTRKAMLEAVHDALGDPMPVGVSVSVEEGHPAAVLCRVAVGADLLVVGSHGHTALPGTRLGSVSRRCAHSAPCPLLIVPVTTAADEERAAEYAHPMEHANATTYPVLADQAAQTGR
ncbi:MAG TPA: universal stress protein [Frankiaceae bacterium]|nr:universal stress protein [Frankiaceae bacterium]